MIMEFELSIYILLELYQRNFFFSVYETTVQTNLEQKLEITGSN